MKVILLKGVPKLGKPEDIVEVNEGYAHNALFPRKLAVPATPAALATLKQKQDGRVAQKAEQHRLLDAAIASLREKELTLAVPANDQGNLFSKIDAKDIASFLFTEHRTSIDTACIVLTEPIKKLGTYDITITDGGFRASVRLIVVKK